MRHVQLARWPRAGGGKRRLQLATGMRLVQQASAAAGMRRVRTAAGMRLGRVQLAKHSESTALPVMMSMMMTMVIVMRG